MAGEAGTSRPEARNPPDRTALSVQWRGHRPLGDTRAERRAGLTAQLRDVLLRHREVLVDWRSVSLAAQTVEVSVGAEVLARTVAALEADGLRVDPVVDRQIVT